MVEPLGKDAKKVRVDGEEAVLHITDQSVMFEKGGKVSGFLRNAIQMVKPEGEAMVIAYSVGNEVKSVRVEPMTAVASLLTSKSHPKDEAGATNLDEVFDRLYRETRKELEVRLAEVEAEPENRSLRLTPEEEKKYSQVSRQLENLMGSRYNFSPGSENNPISFWGLEKQPHELQFAVVKERHIRFLRMIVETKAERNDIAYSTDEVWPDDWPHILERFDLGSGPYTTEPFKNYVKYLKLHWKYQPGQRKPTLLSPN